MGDQNNNNNNNNEGGDDLYWYDDAIYEDGFEGYEPRTVDPGPWALYAVVGMALVCVSLLPFLLAVRQAWKKQRIRRAMERLSQEAPKKLRKQESSMGTSTITAATDSNHETVNDDNGTAINTDDGGTAGEPLSSGSKSENVTVALPSGTKSEISVAGRGGSSKIPANEVMVPMTPVTATEGQQPSAGYHRFPEEEQVFLFSGNDGIMKKVGFLAFDLDAAASSPYPIDDETLTEAEYEEGGGESDILTSLPSPSSTGVLRSRSNAQRAIVLARFLQHVVDEEEPGDASVAEHLRTYQPPFLSRNSAMGALPRGPGDATLDTEDPVKIISPAMASLPSSHEGQEQIQNLQKKINKGKKGGRLRWFGSSSSQQPKQEIPVDEVETLAVRNKDNTALAVHVAPITHDERPSPGAGMDITLDAHHQYHAFGDLPESFEHVGNGVIDRSNSTTSVVKGSEEELVDNKEESENGFRRGSSSTQGIKPPCPKGVYERDLETMIANRTNMTTDLTRQLTDDLMSLADMDEKLDELDESDQMLFEAEEQNSHHKYQVDLLWGYRPWYCFFCSGDFLRKVIKCASWDKEMKKILKLAIPYTAYSIVANFCFILQIGLIGRKLGTPALSAYYTTEFAFSLGTMLFSGILSSLTLLCSQAIGAKNFKLAGQYVRLAILVYEIGFLPLGVYGWYQFDSIVLLLGFDETTAGYAHDYAQLTVLTTIVGVPDYGIHYVLSVAGYERYSVYMSSAHSMVVLGGVFALVYGLPYIGVQNVQLWMVGAVELAAASFFVLLNISIIHAKGWLKGVWRGLYSFELIECKFIMMFFKAALPLSFGYVVEYCVWEVLFIFAAVEGPAEVATWGLLGTIWGVAEYVVLAIGDAAEVRVGHLLGSNLPELARYSCHKSMFLGAASSFLIAGALAGFREQIPGWLTDDETLQELLIGCLPLISAALITLNFGSLSWSILCAQGRTTLATAMTMVGSLFVTLPLAFLSTFAFHLNLKGLVASVCIGYTVSGFLNSFLMICSKWTKISKKVVAKMAIEKRSFVEVDGEILPDYDNYYFQELPPEVAEAARFLGYTKKIWDKGLHLPQLDFDWSLLSPEQQHALRVLGYNQARWDRPKKLGPM